VTANKILSPEIEARLHESFKRNSPETLEAILQYRKTGDTSVVIVAVHGIIERYLSAEKSMHLAESPDSTRLAEDLSIDSLTMLEIVMSIEEALDFRIDNVEAAGIHTLGHVRSFVDDKVHNRPIRIVETKKYNCAEISLLLPQQAPFMFVDQAEIEGDAIRASYLFKGDEFFFAGHFKDGPVVPASIVCEAIGQTGCLWLLEQAQLHVSEPINIKDLLFVGMESIRFHKRLLPGDEIHTELRLTKIREPLAVFEGTVKVAGQLVAKLECLTLAFGDMQSLKSENQSPESPAQVVLPTV